MKITAKDAIKARCADCKESRVGDCNYPECQIFGLKRAKKGCSRTKAIRSYCTWCLNGQNFSACSSVNCPIYLYRTQPKTVSAEIVCGTDSDLDDDE